MKITSGNLFSTVGRQRLQVTGCAGSHRRRNSLLRSQGFTLLELLAVVILLVILVGMTIPIAVYVNRKVAITQTQADIKTLELAIERYKVDNGAYPTSSMMRAYFGGGQTMITNRALAIINSAMLYNQLSNSSKVYIQIKASQLASNKVVSGFVTNYYWTIVDHWNTPLNYVCTRPPVPITARMVPTAGTGQVNVATFDLWSYGPDFVNGTADDVTNWKQQ